MAKKSRKGLSTPLLYIVLGALLVIFRAQTLDWAMTLAAIVFIVSGIVDIAKKRTSSGLVNLLIGIVVLILGWTIAGVVLLVLGVLIAVKGLVELINELKRSRVTVVGILYPALTMLVGLALAFGNGLNYMIVGVGVLLIVDGVLGIVGSRK